MSPGTRRTAIGFVMLVGLGVAGRLLPHPPNATQVVAVALFAAWALPGRVAAAVPLMVLALSDLALGSYEPGVMASVYLGLLAPLGFRRVLGPRPTAARVGVATVGSSLAFFAATNLAVWAFGGWYAPTAAGLRDCFVAALPFYRNGLAADLLGSAALFGGAALAARLARRPSAEVGRAVA